MNETVDKTADSQQQDQPEAGADRHDFPVAVLSGGRSVQPLLKPLAETFNLALLYPKAAEQAAARGLPVANLAPWADDRTRAQSVNEALRLCSGLFPALEAGTLAKPFEDTIGHFSADGTVENLGQWFPNWVLQSVSRQVLRLKLWRRLVDEFDVKICITHEDVCEDTKGMVQFFRTQGVPTLHVPHAVYLDQWRAAPGLDVHDEIACEHLAAAGSFQRDWYVERGFPENEVTITGSPSWDKWSQPPDKVWARNALKLLPAPACADTADRQAGAHDEPVVVYASSWPQHTSLLGFHGLVAECYEAFLGAAKEAGWQPVVKLHPNAGQASHHEHAKLATEAGVKCLVTPSYLDIVMQAADLVVAMGPSNILIEAALMGVPAVSVLGYADDEAIITCELDGTGAAIERGLSEGWRQEFTELRGPFVEKYAYCDDGGATGRVLELVEELSGV